eukprot:NODE_4998_length_1822_cov_3.420649.p1 GENE.NODE_4998_length_1822_cov_3.420649~~NODE_4998_length_1822_cov_3.420649.p1  ORF type:complete len:453 (+),score=141.90 NODE_4998_length_1822_cov_3.420649:256-1614(+)
MNPGQRAAVEAVMHAQDYLIIAGYPGTGKTEVIAALLAALAARQERVLLCSHTHTAVDNLLLRLRKESPALPFVRCGNLKQVHADLHDRTLTSRDVMPKWSSVSEVAAFATAQRLVACTCTSAASEILASTLRFDTVVIEEASQAMESALWAPLLRCSGRFVLVGDGRQLPPLVRHPRARAEGMDRSLLERLSAAHAGAAAELTEQYRMNEGICSVVNGLFYSGLLHSSVEVASGRLELHAAVRHAWAPWITDALDPGRSVVFADTDTAGDVAREAGERGATCNAYEIKACVQLARALVEAGVARSDILVISPLRKQLTLLETALAADAGTAGIEALTIDRAQGRSVRCVLVSFVRSNPEGHVGTLLCDWRRLNVALSRAKHKLVLVGSSSTLAGACESDGKVAGTTPLVANAVEASSDGRQKLRELVEISRARAWVLAASQVAVSVSGEGA